MCAYSQPDRPTGRGRKLTPCAVKQTALAAGIEVRQPKSLRSEEALAELAASELDVLVVAAYGLILPEAILASPSLGCINVHASLLPRWRGAAPIERSIMAGDTQSGVCIMRMEAGLDTGGIYATKTLPITDTTTGRELHDSVAQLGLTALLATLDGFTTKAAADDWQPQDDSLATYADKLQPLDARIEWHNSAASIVRQINALNDRLPARTELAGETLNLLRAQLAVPLDSAAETEAEPQAPGTIIARSKKAITVATGDGALSVREVQLRRGKGRPMPMAAALNGYGELFELGNRFE